MASEMVCTQCGASLPHPDLKGFASCLACGHVNRVDRGDLEAEEAQEQAERAERAAARAEAAATGRASAWTTPVTAGGWEPAARTVVLTKTNQQVKVRRRTAGAIGCLVPILVVLGVVGAVVWGLRQPGGPLDPDASTSKLYPSGGTMEVLPGEASSADAVFAVTDNSADSARRLVRADLMTGEVIWKAVPWDEGTYDAELAASGKDLWVGAGDRVGILSLATGKERFSVILSDKVTTGCAGCFTVFGDTLVVRSDDGFLTGFGPASSEPRWRYRLVSPSAKPTVVGSRLVVIDDGATGEAPVTAQTIDPATGKVIKAVDPACPDDGEISGDTELEIDTRIHPIPGTDDVVAAFGTSYACIARWQTTTGDVRWRTRLPSGLSFIDDEVGLASAADFVFGDTDNGTSRIDLATGKVLPLEPLPDTEATGRVIVGRTLVAETDATRGTKSGLAAWNLDTGKRLWATQLPTGTTPVDQDDGYRWSESVSEGSDKTLLVGTGTGVRLVTFDGPDHAARTQEIDLATGELGEATERKLPTRYSSASSSMSITIQSVTASRLILTVDSLVSVVPLGTAGEVRRFPR